jgi:hypothetical protein
MFHQKFFGLFFRDTQHINNRIIFSTKVFVQNQMNKDEDEELY